MSQHDITRRAFLAAVTTSAAAGISGCATRVNSARVVPGRISPNERLNIAAIGAGGMGRGDINGCKSENIVALCDPDWKNAAESFFNFRHARQFKDYREMLDAMPEIDACTISTPDHSHAPAAYRAMKLGKHVYVQKPLSHTVAEARLLNQVARETGVVTQMGNQGNSGDGVREFCEILWSGAIGDVHEAHTWTNRPIWPQGHTEALPEEFLPSTMDWDVWLGPAAERPYNSGYAPFAWRGWWDFGCGALGDMACHIMDPPWWALKLGEADSYTVELLMEEGMTEHSPPVTSTVKYAFPARADMSACDLYWYEGSRQVDGAEVPNLPAHPEGVPEDENIGGGRNGSLLHGSGGILTAATYGGSPRLLPAARMDEFEMPEPVIPRVPDGNHYLAWINACKGVGEATSHFGYSGPFTEMVLLGNVAMLTRRKLHYDARTGTITNDPEANALLTKSYRPGWELPV